MLEDFQGFAAFLPLLRVVSFLTAVVIVLSDTRDLFRQVLFLLSRVDNDKPNGHASHTDEPESEELEGPLASR